MRILDPQLRPLVTDRAVHTVDDAGLLQVLAALADDGANGASDLLARLQAPGLDAAARLQLVLAGLDAQEKADVEALLDRGDLVFSAAGRNFLEAVCGRAPLQDVVAQASVDADGQVAGTLRPGERVEVLNLSTAPTGNARLRDTVQVGAADATGAGGGGGGAGDAGRRRVGAAGQRPSNGGGWGRHRGRGGR